MSLTPGDAPRRVHDPGANAAQPTDLASETAPGSGLRRVFGSLACIDVAAAVLVIGLLLSGPFAETTDDETTTAASETQTPEPPADTIREDVEHDDVTLFDVLPTAEDFGDQVGSLTRGVNYWNLDESPEVASADDVEANVVDDVLDMLGHPSSYDAWLRLTSDARCEEFADRVVYFEDYRSIVDDGRLRARSRTSEQEGEIGRYGWFTIEAMGFAQEHDAQDFARQAREHGDACDSVVEMDGMHGRYTAIDLGDLPVDYLAYDATIDLLDDGQDSERREIVAQADGGHMMPASVRTDDVDTFYGTVVLLVHDDTVVHLNVFEARSSDIEHVVRVAAAKLADHG